MAGHLNLHRKIVPDSSVGRILIEHIESGDVFSVTPIAGWHEHGTDWVTIACADPSMRFRFLRDEIAPRDLTERADPPRDADEGPVRGLYLDE